MTTNESQEGPSTRNLPGERAGKLRWPRYDRYLSGFLVSDGESVLNQRFRWLNLRFRYALRDVWYHRSRTALVILSIAVGIFAFGLILGAANTLTTELPLAYQAIRPASATLHTSPFDDSFVNAVGRMPEVAVAEGKRSERLRFLQPSGEWHDMQIFALEDYGKDQVNIVRPSQGPWPPPENELLVERNSLFLLEAEIGDTILVETNQGHQRSMRIAGLAHDMNQAPAQITGIPYVYATRDTLEWLGMTRQFNKLEFIVAEGQFDKLHIEKVALEAADKLERSGLTIFWIEVPEPGHHFFQDFLPTIVLILGALGILALVLSGFLVVNVISAILSQQTRYIGIMKAVGARIKQVARLYLYMVGLFGLLALVLAIPLGGWGAGIFSRFIAGQLNFDIEGNRIAPYVLALELFVGVLTPVIAAFYPIMATVRVTVREAIQEQGLGDDVGGAGINHFVLLLQKVLPDSRPLRLSLRNTFRRRGRLLRTLVPLTLGGAIFMSILSVRASLFLTLEETLESQGFDIQIQTTRAYRAERLYQSTARVPHIETVELWSSGEAIPVRPDEREGDRILLYGVPVDTQLLALDLIDGRWLAPEDQNTAVVPIKFLKDEPTVETSKDFILKIQGVESDWRVVGVYETFQSPIAPAVVYVSQASYWREAGDYDHGDTLRILTDDHDATTHQIVVSALEEEFGRRGIDIRSTRTATEDRDIFTERFNIITVVFTIMAFLLAVVGSLGLMATMTINVLERRREIGVMRAIGASDAAVVQIFVVEGVVIGVLSWFGAIVLSQPISRLLSWRIGLTLLQWPLSYIYDLRAPFLWIGIVIVVSALSSLVPARNAANLRVRETLAYE